MNSKKFIDNLKKLVTIQSESYNTRDMARYIVGVVQSIGDCTISYDKYKNIYVTKGDNKQYDCMVCHIDTVHSIVKAKIQAININGNIIAINTKTMEQHGTGGDDKVGIHITLEMLKKRKNFKAAFFLDEEVGCIGSSQADYKFFDDCKFILECDRQGYKDFVDQISGTSLFSKEFRKDIKPIIAKYGREIVNGGMTDVVEIAYNTDKCVANMSCGYYRPHTETEYINIEDVIDTYNLCNDLYDMNDKMYVYEKTRSNPYYLPRYNMYGGGYYHDNKDALSLSAEDEAVIDFCGNDCFMHDGYCAACMMESKELLNFFENEDAID